ncbi:MAG: hypothetical protein K2O24_08705 [Muribaculaceae bacterium]|nr:hypothetical protein [Muribaculaceae bacterium]
MNIPALRPLRGSLLLLAASAIAAPLCTASAADEVTPETMYLVKDNRVVGRYDASAVDYITFDLPGDIIETPIWLTVDEVGRNNVTYTVSTETPSTAYVHNIISWYLANMYAMTYYGGSIDELDEATADYILKLCLESAAYIGMGTDTYTQRDYEDDGTGNEYYTSRFSVQPATKYFLVAWEVDPVTQEPLDTMVKTTFTTLDPGVSPYKVEVESLGQVEDGLAFDFSGTSGELLYVTTVFGYRSTMEAYIAAYGEDNLFGTWGQNWTPDQLLEDAVWMVDESGEYVMMCRGFDADGNMTSSTPVYATYEAPQSEGPKIEILSRSKGDGKVSVGFEITPSNVSEAYVYVDTENNVDDMLNDGWKLWEIASRPKALDVTYEINTMGEYNYSCEVTPDIWHTMLIYALDDSSNRSVCRINFNTAEDSTWDVINPAGRPLPSRIRPAIRHKGASPVIKKNFQHR